jgi:GntR family transcriptional regulator, vanillate catabolism transcriptional regulator
MPDEMFSAGAGEEALALPGVESKNRATRSACLLEHLRQTLLDGAYPLGTRMNEVHLSRQLNVSRTPVRAALQTLAGEGLLQYTPNRGFTVREFPLSEIVEAYEMRALAEGLAARLVAERGLAENAQTIIREALEDGDRALAGEADIETRRTSYAQINKIFHSTIIQAANSGLVADVIRLCQRMPQASAHNVIAFDLADVRERHAAHHRIYAAIANREPREAEALMREHILAVELSMIRRIAYAAADSPGQGILFKATLEPRIKR